VAARGVCHAFGRREALHEVDLAVHAGEIVTLIGPNGSGKTTLVRLLLGFLRPWRGRIERRPGLVVGYVPQHFEIDRAMPLTVRRFLTLASASGAAIGRAVADAGIGDLVGRSFADLSGGERQRALIARALARQPQLLVLDEPTQGVDVSGQAELYALIQRIRSERGVGVLLVSHDLHLVMEATDRVVCLNHHVCCAGRPESVAGHPEFLALFGAGAAPGLAVYQHRHDHRHDLTGEVVGGAPFRRHGPRPPETGDGAR
jgi:zinc transport system ATP-binding protein